MLTGVPPFTGEDSDALRRRHAIEDVAPLRSVAKHVPAALAHAIEEALVKDPDDRTPDLAALELALVAAQRDAEIVTPWDSDIAAQSERASTAGEAPATSGVFQTVSGRGGKRSPSGSHRPVTAAANSPGRSVVAVGPSARAATRPRAAAIPNSAPTGSKMPRPHGAAAIHTKVVRPIAEAPAKPAEAKPVEVKPKPVEAKPVEAKPAEAKPVEAKPVEAKPVEAKPVEAKPLPKLASPGRIPPPPRMSSRPARRSAGRHPRSRVRQRKAHPRRSQRQRRRQRRAPSVSRSKTSTRWRPG